VKELNRKLEFPKAKPPAASQFGHRRHTNAHAELEQRQEAKHIQEHLVEALLRYDELHDLAPVSFLTLDRRGTILALNKPASTLLGFSTEWLHERPFLPFVASKDIPRFLSVLTRIRRAPDYQETLEIELSVGDRSVPVQLSIKSSIRNNQTIYRIAVVDLTDTKTIEKELKVALANWYSLVETAPDIIMTVDRKAKITFVNRDAWGYASHAIVGTVLTDFVSGKDREKIEKCIAAAFTSDKPSTCEISDVNGDKDHWYSLSFGPVRWRELRRGTITITSTTTTVTIRDITEHKRTEQSLRASREQLREFAGRLEQVREEERTRVAREIHDELGQKLTILKLDLAWLSRKARVDSVTRKKIKSMIADVDQTIGHVRKIVSELRPSILDEMGLCAALEWQIGQFQQRTGIRGIFESTSEDFDLPPNTAAALFRVVQEALTNVVRHAGARQVRVALKPARGILRIAVSDDGKGLPRGQINDRKSFGIVGMRERVHRIGGEFNIFSGPGRGTRLEIAAPLK
jgi:PAS domain S-box-containing protein